MSASAAGTNFNEDPQARVLSESTILLVDSKSKPSRDLINSILGELKEKPRAGSVVQSLTFFTRRRADVRYTELPSILGALTKLKSFSWKADHKYTSHTSQTDHEMMFQCHWSHFPPNLRASLSARLVSLNNLSITGLLQVPLTLIACIKYLQSLELAYPLDVSTELLQLDGLRRLRSLAIQMDPLKSGKIPSNFDWLLNSLGTIPDRRAKKITLELKMSIRGDLKDVATNIGTEDCISRIFARQWVFVNNYLCTLKARGTIKKVSFQIGVASPLLIVADERWNTSMRGDYLQRLYGLASRRRRKVNPTKPVLVECSINADEGLCSPWKGDTAQTSGNCFWYDQ